MDVQVPVGQGIDINRRRRPGEIADRLRSGLVTGKVVVAIDD